MPQGLASAPARGWGHHRRNAITKRIRRSSERLELIEVFVMPQDFVAALRATNRGDDGRPSIPHVPQMIGTNR
jgi:hypothetical protein